MGISIDKWSISTEKQLAIHPNPKTRHPREICGLNTYSVSAKTAKLFAVHFDVDAAVNKRTLIVVFGVPASAWIYRIALIASFVIAIAAAALYPPMFYAGLLYLLTLPAAIAVLKALNKDDLAKPSQYKASKITVLVHTIGSLTLAAGFIISGLFA